jgi:hypothetical protein
VVCAGKSTVDGRGNQYQSTTAKAKINIAPPSKGKCCFL